jgi:hypothetical protein
MSVEVHIFPPLRSFRVMPMQTFRQRQRQARLRTVERLIRDAGSVRQAAKVAGMRRPDFIRMRNNLKAALSHKYDILTAPAAADTK